MWKKVIKEAEEQEAVKLMFRRSWLQPEVSVVPHNFPGMARNVPESPGEAGDVPESPGEAGDVPESPGEADKQMKLTAHLVPCSWSVHRFYKSENTPATGI